MMIDAHQHFWSYERGDYGWMAEDEALAAMRRDFMPPDYQRFRARHGIDATILVQAAPTTAETRWLLDLAEASDWIAKVVGWVDFERPEDRVVLEEFAAHPKFAGVRPMIQDIPDAGWMHRPDVQWGFAALAEMDLTLDALGFPIHLDGFLDLFERHPDMRVVVDHCMKPRIRDYPGDPSTFHEWSDGLARIAEETPAFCKLSGLICEARPDWSARTLRPFTWHALDVFGPERVMWGSNWPVVTLNGDFDRWLETARELVPEADRAQVFGDTAARFYRIG